MAGQMPVVVVPGGEFAVDLRDRPRQVAKNLATSAAFACIEKNLPQALRACLHVVRRDMSLSPLFSLSGLSAPGATWEEDEREMSFFCRGSALQRRASRLQILDDGDTG